MMVALPGCPVQSPLARHLLGATLLGERRAPISQDILVSRSLPKNSRFVCLSLFSRQDARMDAVEDFR